MVDLAQWVWQMILKKPGTPKRHISTLNIIVAQHSQWPLRNLLTLYGSPVELQEGFVQQIRPVKEFNRSI